MRGMRFLAWVFLGVLGLPVALMAATFPDSPRTPEAASQAPRFELVPPGPLAASESGVAEFGGPSSAVTDISLKLQQLAPGLYWVVMVRKSDGAAVTLAALSVFDTSDIEPDRQANDDPKVRTSGHQGVVLETQVLIKLPAPFNLADMGELLVEDVNGVPVLAGTPQRP